MDLVIYFGVDQQVGIDNIANQLKENGVIKSFVSSPANDNMVRYKFKFTTSYGIYLFGHAQGSGQINTGRNFAQLN